MDKYVHDINARIVYRFPNKPNVTKQLNQGRHVGWFITMEIRVTRADNWLKNDGHWSYPIFKNPSEHYFFPGTEVQALALFLTNHEPDGTTIDNAEYDRLHQMYQSEAKSRH